MGHAHGAWKRLSERTMRSVYNTFSDPWGMHHSRDHDREKDSRPINHSMTVNQGQRYVSLPSDPDFVSASMEAVPLMVAFPGHAAGQHLWYTTS